MKQISFNDAAQLCIGANQPIFITPDGRNNLILMNENTFNEYEEAKRVEDVLLGFEKNKNNIDGELFFKELKQKYEL